LLLDTRCTQKTITSNPIHVTLPNGQVIASSHTAQLPFPKLPKAALQAHVFLQLRNHALLSIGAFCDAGCKVTFKATSVRITYNNEVVLEGTREPPGLWTAKLEPSLQANASFAAPFKATAIKHIHASLFSPTTQTWTKAIDNNHLVHGHHSIPMKCGNISLNP
jgi:hypothetical protein